MLCLNPAFCLSGLSRYNHHPNTIPDVEPYDLSDTNDDYLTPEEVDQLMKDDAEYDRLTKMSWEDTDDDDDYYEEDFENEDY